MQVDLHIHSYYSDGTMSPQEIITKAKAKGLAKIAITDHNEIKGALEAKRLAPDYVILGVELDALIDGIDVHILAYNFNLASKEFTKLIDANRLMLERVDDELITKLVGKIPQVNLEAYHNFQYDRTKGGWKALQYLISLGLIEGVEGCFTLMKQVNHSHAAVPFLSVEEVIKAIHKAGGKAILAHPGKTFPKDKIDYYLAKMLGFKIDGIECFYPKHSEEERKKFVAFAQKNNLLITCGCDCHGTFQQTEIGELKVASKELNLKGLWEE